MTSEHHATSLVKDAIIGISGYIIKGSEKGSVGVFIGGILLLGELVETNKKFVINSSSVI